jgi:hypothetical protein
MSTVKFNEHPSANAFAATCFKLTQPSLDSYLQDLLAMAIRQVVLLFCHVLISALSMHFKRAVLAVSHEFTQPPIIQIGNSVQNFSTNPALKNCFQFDQKFPSQVMAGLNLVKRFRLSAMRGVMLLFFIFMAATSWAQTGSVYDIVITPRNDSVGAATTYIISFKADAGLKANDKILLYFPKDKGFDLSGVLVANNRQNLDGGFIVTVNTSEAVVGIERDGHGVDLPPDVLGSFRIATVGNPTKPNSYDINMVTQRGLNALNSGVGSVTIKAGPLDHFAFSSTINNQIAGQNFNFTILGKDKFNNNVAVNDSILFSDHTGTLTPKRVRMNNVPSLTVAAKITQAQNGVAITATAKTLGKSGVSNSFNVAPGSLSAFLLSSVPSTLVAGAPLTLTMTAQDASGNTVTSFNGSVNFTPSGEIQPAKSGNFSNGVRSEMIAYLKSGSNKIITVNDGLGHSGASNSFTVTPDKPSGTITFTANPKAIPPDRKTPSQISSSAPIQDAYGNNVGGGKLFTISVNDTSFGTITTADADPNTPGQQIATSSSVGSVGRLGFTFKAGGKGGTATIFVSSVDGTASGSVNISVNHVKLLAVATTPATVSQGQRNIPVKMRVQNFGADTVSIDSAKLSFSRNAADFTVKAPVLPKIPGNAIRTLTFSVSIAPNAQTGAVTIDGQIFGKLSSGIKYSDTNADTTASWTVQTPAKLSVSLKASQATVTQRQTLPWKVTMTVRNDGQGAVQVILRDDSTRTTLAAAGHAVSPPAGPIIIAGESAKNLDFVVTATSDTAKSRQTIHGQVFARELNSDSLHFAGTSNNGSAQVTVQTPARVVLDPPVLFEVYNGDTVNVGQKFLIKASVKQTQGTEKVDSVRVKLANFNGNNAAIFKDTLVVANNLTQSIFFELTANNVAPKKAQFRANIVAAYSANTGANTVLFDGASKFVEAYIQQKGNLQFDKITTSESTVRFGRTAPWTITVDVSNPAPLQAGAVVIDSTIFTFKAGQNVQRDYAIEKVTPDSLLNAGKSKTLLFRVTKTGTTSGTVTITATVHAHHKNSREKITASKATSIVVESTALVAIAKTSFPASVNRVAGTDIALVDTGQVFPINVTVRNTGFEKVDKAWVTLSTKGRSQIINRQRQAGPIDTENGTAVATFMVKAEAAVNSSGEIFTAHLDSAKNAVGKKVSVSPALDGKDTTAVVRLELPARLQLSLVTGDGSTAFSRGQQFKVRALVKNLGQGQTDKSGELQISFSNNNYQFVGNEPSKKNFAGGDSVEWNIQAPSNESRQDVFVVRMIKRPIAKNSGQPADTVNATAQLAVSTLQNALNIQDKFVLAPAGARDRTISTDQIFTAAAKIQASSNLSNKTATLTLPAGSGYRFVNGDSATKKVTSDTVSWLVQAPSIENLKPFKLPLEAKAFDRQQMVAARDTLVILATEKQAILQLEPGIKEAGAQDGLVSSNQSFTIVAKLRNTGRASVDGAVEVTIKPPSTMRLQEAPQKTAVFSPGISSREVTWQVRAASQPTPPNQQERFVLEITQRPRDVNSGLEVLTSNDPAQLDVKIVETGTLFADPPRITAPAGAKDRILSTGQEFTISDSLSWTNAANLTAELIFAPNTNFTVFNPVQTVSGANKTGSINVSWIIRAPAAPVNDIKARVIFKAVDAHNQALPLLHHSDSIAIKVVQRAELSLSAGIAEPASATNGIVGIGQPFKVVATILNAAATGVYDTAKVRLMLPEGYTLIDTPKTLLKAAKLPGDNTFAWWVRARADISETADLLKFKLIQPPRDENTDAFAAISDDQTELNVRAEGRKLVVEDLRQGGGPAVRGGQNVLLARLQLLNPARPGSSNLMLKRLSFDVLNRAGKPLEPTSVFKAVRVIHEKAPASIPGGENNSLANNPIVVVLATGVSVSTDKADTIAIVADLFESTTEQNFRLLFDDSQDFEVEDQAGSSGVVVETTDGRRGNKFRLESNLTVLHGADAASSFFNYPNPFQPGDDPSRGEGTRFNLPAGASGELKIFTMLGELVWGTAFEARTPLGVQGVFWNGHNGAGKRVLNGVYLAVLKTKDGKMATTKVAVLKKQ